MAPTPRVDGGSVAGLSARTVAGLDAARAGAACYVVVHHVFAAHGWLGGAGIVFRFGQEAVLVFFLLSGFVIFASERTRALSPRGYYWRRLRRIYPPLLVAMALSTAVALADGDLAARFSWGSLLGTLASVQDIAALKPGVIVDPYLDNFPLWSLSYEVAFYLVFPPILTAWTRWPRRTGHIVGLACCAAYGAYVLHPDHFALVGAYFLIWWSGAMAAHAYLRGARGIRALLPELGWLGALALVTALAVVLVGYRGAGVYPVLPLRHVITAALLLAVFFGPPGRALARIAYRHHRPIRFVASISYGLYLFHYPLLVDWDQAYHPGGFAIALAILVGLAWLTEHRLTAMLPRAPRT